jgi:hypothetical protein
MLAGFEKERDRLEAMMSNRGGAAARVSDASAGPSIRPSPASVVRPAANLD